MPSEKHQQKACELLPQIITAARAFGGGKALQMFAAALEAVERETEARVKAETATFCAEMLETRGVMLPIMPNELRCDHAVRFRSGSRRRRTYECAIRSRNRIRGWTAAVLSQV